MSVGAEIAAEIRAGLIEAGEGTGDGPNYCVIRRNDPNATTAADPVEAETLPTFVPVDHELVMIEGANMVKDQAGTLTGEVTRTLTIEATGVTPLKSDLIAINTRLADVDGDTVFEEVMGVKTTKVGGVALLHKVYLKD